MVVGRFPTRWESKIIRMYPSPEGIAVGCECTRFIRLRLFDYICTPTKSFV
ncbi:hypothetical protein HMPREF1990_00656 [Porphyromonas gingivalis W4087]|nr:hypothetical protein HMPREF1553_01657 [Porphyromonas gingivalis F0568]ERJ84335.1 hypothetical protein HMPREF1988_00812 [Porphyromonas gingivalis F0185]ERJ90154.1 hypothetical protein HMPREF1990_00656 [Porphyromonas gingivalis W4087]